MEKIIITCKKCKKKMKIMNNPAKYRCPHCQNIIKFTKVSKVLEKTKRVFKDGIKTFKDLFKTISYNFKVAKNQYKQVKKMKKKNK